MRQSGHYTSEKPFTKEVFMDLLEKKILGLNLQAAKEDIKRFIRDPRDTDGWSIDFFKSLLPQIQFSSEV